MRTNRATLSPPCPSGCLAAYRCFAPCLTCPKEKLPKGELFKCRSGPVSRVLSSKTAIYLGRASPRVSSRLPACTERLSRIACLFALASDGVYLSHAVTNVLVRSYRTFSAFLLTRGAEAPSASGSLSFFSTNPSGFPARPLAGILPQEARTFLTRAHPPATVRPA